MLIERYNGVLPTHLMDGRKRATCSTTCGVVMTSIAAKWKAAMPAGILRLSSRYFLPLTRSGQAWRGRSGWG